MTSEDADTAILVARAYLETDNHRRAEAVLRVALATDPHHPRMLALYGRALCERSEYVGAADAALAALAVEPHDEYAMRIHARALQGQGRVEEALAVAWRTVTAHPHSSFAHYERAQMLDAAGRPSDALAAVDEARRLDPLDADSLSLRGDILLALLQVDPAREAYEDALRLQPDHAHALHGLAVTRYARFRPWLAIDGFLRVGRLHPVHGDVVRANVATVVTSILRRTSWLVLVVALAVVTTSVQHVDGHSTAVARTVAGLGAVLLFVTHTRLWHHMPREPLKSVLRQRKLLVVRAIQVFTMVVLGAQTAMLGAMWLPAVLSALTILTLPVIVVLGAVTGERLG